MKLSLKFDIVRLVSSSNQVNVCLMHNLVELLCIGEVIRLVLSRPIADLICLPCAVEMARL